MAFESGQLIWGLALVALAAVIGRHARLAWRRLLRRRLDAARARILAVADGVLEDVESALQQLGCSEVVTDADGHAQLDACVERLTAVLMGAASVAGRATELCSSPHIARSRTPPEVLRLLRINADRIAQLRRSADEELAGLRQWLERSWAQTGGCSTQPPLEAASPPPGSHVPV